MNDQPRRTLAELLTRFGRSVIDDPRRFEALFRDYAGPHRREANAIIAALRERVPEGLLASHGGMPPALLLGRLSSRLEEDLGLAPEVSRWAVETWALALAVVSEADLQPPSRQPQPAPAVPPSDGTAVAVLLWAAGPDRTAIIRAVRVVTLLGPEDAAALIDAAPVTVIEGLERQEAEYAAATLRSAGATVDVVPSDSRTRRVPGPAPRPQQPAAAPPPPQTPPGSGPAPSGTRNNPSPPPAGPAGNPAPSARPAPSAAPAQPRYTTVRTLAGSGQKGHADGFGTSAQFNSPKGIAIDARGILYIADDGNRRIRRITPDGAVATFAGTGRFFDSAKDGHVSAAGFFSPESIDIDGRGVIYVADVGRVRFVRPDGMIETFGHEFEVLRGLAVTPSGVIYVSGAACLFRVLASGGFERIGEGPPYAGHKDGAPGKAQFNAPSGLAVGANGAVYVADTDNHRIRTVMPDGQVGTLAGKTNWLGHGGYADGPADEARFKSPRGVAVDAAGNVYVADTGNHRIRRIGRDGTVTTVAGSGERGSKDGPALVAEFDRPRDLAVGPDGTLYVVDEGNHCVRAIGP
jgi:DNA-binding beta-propeller fold protein YncE